MITPEWGSAEKLEASLLEPASAIRPKSKKLSEFKTPPKNDPNELLKHRFLCRCGGLLLVGPSGIGKSSLVMQLAMHWSIGLPAFGIVPAKGLKILVVQAENDEGDLAEMRNGVIAGVALTEAQSRAALDNIRFYHECGRAGLEFFVQTLEPLIADDQPDLVIIDPALAYLGGETNSQVDVGRFLRLGLNPLLQKYNVGAVVVHHTNKPPSGREKRSWEREELAYMGSGSAEWTNWARAILVLRASGLRDELDRTIFELSAPKKGDRLRWKTAEGDRTRQILLAHSRIEGEVCWYEVPIGDASKLTEKNIRDSGTADDLYHAIPEKGIEKKVLIDKKIKGIGLQKARKLIGELVAANKVVEQRVKRKGSPPQVVLRKL